MTTQALLYNKIFQDYKKYYYNKEAKFYRKKIFLNQIRRFGDKKKSVIEVGCGPGYSFKILKDSGFKFKSYYGVDVSNESVKNFQDSIKNNIGFLFVSFLNSTLSIFNFVLDSFITLIFTFYLLL